MSTSKSLLLAHAGALTVLAIMINGASNFQDITDALAFYGVYHRDPINQVIHFFGVPCIIWSALLFTAHLKIHPSVVVKIPFAPNHSLSYATVITIGYILFYTYLDTFGGLLFAPFIYFQYITAVLCQTQDQLKAKNASIEMEKKKNDDTPSKDINKKNGSATSSWTGTGRALKLALWVHILGWYVQIHPGHGVFEGAKPAILQSIGGALTSAPLFAYYEGLWFLGLNKDLQLETKVLVDIYTKELCDSGVTMTACADYN